MQFALAWAKSTVAPVVSSLAMALASRGFSGASHTMSVSRRELGIGSLAVQQFDPEPSVKLSTSPMCLGKRGAICTFLMPVRLCSSRQEVAVSLQPLADMMASGGPRSVNSPAIHRTTLSNRGLRSTSMAKRSKRIFRDRRQHLAGTPSWVQSYAQLEHQTRLDQQGLRRIEGLLYGDGWPRLSC